VRAGNVARNGKTEPASTFVLIARIVEPKEWLEHLFRA